MRLLALEAVTNAEQPGFHPHPVQLERFLRGELTRAEVRPVVRHLLTRCPECLPLTRRLWALGGPAR